MKTIFHNHSALFLLSHYRMLWRVILSELRARYAGSILGLGWAILTPLFMLIVYAVVYLVIFRVRVPGLSSIDYMLYVFSGLVPFLMLNEALIGGIGSVVAGKAIWSNTVFPIDLVPVKAVLLSQVSMIVGFTVILVSLTATGGLKWTLVFLPVVWLLQILMLLGLAWILALVNLVFRDLQNVIGILLLAVMVVSPIAYTPDMVPTALRILVVFNPFAYYVLSFQQIVVLGQLPDWGTVVAMTVISFGAFGLGGYYFSRAKSVFIDYV